MSAAPTVLLDTNIISTFMRDPHGMARQWLDAVCAVVPDLRVVTSVIVDGELRLGLARRPSPRLQAAYASVMQIIEVLPLPTEAAAHYATLRAYLDAQGQPIGPNDTLIAAHALALGATLVSGDDEFGRVPGLKMENWLRPLDTPAG